MFIGRKKELDALHSLLGSDGFKACLIYGRRRVGKSELIHEAVKGYQGTVIYFEAKQVAYSLNIASLGETVAKELGLPAFIHFRSFDDILEAVFSESEKRDMALVLDEFSYLPLGGDNGADASLAKAIDSHRTSSSHLKLIVSGSYIDVLMKMIESRRPLHGRFDESILVREFDYYDAAEFFPSYSAEEKFKAYACFSGLPYALSLVDPSLSVDENIKRLYCRSGGVLDLFVQETLGSEMSKVEGLNSVLNLVGRGVRKFGDIVAALGKESRPEYALEKAVSMRILRREYPINEPNNRKLTFYSWEDPLLYFYFRYVMSPSASRDLMGADTYFNEIIAGDLASFYLPTMFERVSGEYLARKNRKGLVDPPISAIGTYFHNDRLNKKNQQFDVVTLDKNGYISYECKYTDAPVGPEVFKEESEQTSGSELPFYRLGFFAKNGFSKVFPKDDCICASLADFYDEKLGD